VDARKGAPLKASLRRNKEEMSILDEITLEEEQQELLAVLVEATRNVPRDEREKFYVCPCGDRPQWSIRHPGIERGKGLANIGDFEILGINGLLFETPLSGYGRAFEVMPEGFEYYREMKAVGAQHEHVERDIRDYVHGDAFGKKYGVAFSKWAEAERMLWATDSERQLTTIGHHCREAAQAFATALVSEFKPPDVDADPAHTVARIKSVLAVHRENLGDAHTAYLAALLAYWGTVNDLIQRQEHAAQRESETLKWEDGRRVVFSTLLVMYELDRAFCASSQSR
jgi:hypothetical protein